LVKDVGGWSTPLM